MAQRNRFDEPGAWLHVMNRGIARRTVFERRDDMRYFLAVLARMVRKGLIEIHAYCLLVTHFHLLVRSLVGESWRAMRFAQNAYSRRFNRLRRRDGPLFRGRFRSKRVASERYWVTVVRYIDDNSRHAGLASTPGNYPYGSAWHYRRSRGPIWLSRDEVEARATGGIAAFTPELYDVTYGAPLSDAERQLVGARLSTTLEVEDPFDDLVGQAPERVAEWMRYKARHADGTRPGLPVATASTVATLLAEIDCRRPDWTVIVSGVARSGLELLGAGVLRLACGLSFREIAARLQCSPATVRGRVQSFRQALEGDATFVAVAADTIVRATELDWPGATSRVVRPCDERTGVLTA